MRHCFFFSVSCSRGSHQFLQSPRARPTPSSFEESRQVLRCSRGADCQFLLKNDCWWKHTDEEIKAAKRKAEQAKAKERQQEKAAKAAEEAAQEKARKAAEAKAEAKPAKESKTSKAKVLRFLRNVR